MTDTCRKLYDALSAMVELAKNPPLSSDVFMHAPETEAAIIALKEADQNGSQS